MADQHSAIEKETILTKLRTWYLPTPDDIGLIQDDLASLSKELGRLDELPSGTERIPYDLVQEIFLACLSTDHNTVMSIAEAPLLLGRICSAWRALAIATPRIWASLHVHVGFSIQSDDRVRSIAQWLGRSAACPLSLSICGLLTPSWGFESASLEAQVEPSRSDPVHAAYTLLLETLINSAPRWHDITLSNLRLSYLHKFRDISAPLLRAIRISDETDITQWFKLIAVSSVRTLGLEVVLPGDRTLFLPVLSHITHLAISAHGGDWGPVSISGTYALEILHNLKQLVSLKIAIWVPEPELPNQTIHLPVLTSLELRASWWHVASFLECLIMPALLHFTVDSGSMAMPNPATSMWTPFCRKSPLIQSLKLNLPNFTQETLRQTLQPFSWLVNLVLQDCSRDQLFDANFVLTFLAEPPQMNVCPLLRTLEIHCSGSMTDESLTTFLRARAEATVGGFRLKFVLVDPRAVIPNIQRFRDQGLDISLVEWDSCHLVPVGLSPRSGLLIEPGWQPHQY
ncbi:hypothetical protein C8R43DRAFT_1136647 [Mycena crocata]|nr:hypothetical protein C8R43DRAFT_1136647 [Mycena crocata]